MKKLQEQVSFIWSIAELLRGPFKSEDYGKVVFPIAFLHHLDCVLADTKEEVLVEYAKFIHFPEESRDEILNRKAGESVLATLVSMI